jgi:hypothetical protein
MTCRPQGRCDPNYDSPAKVLMKGVFSDAPASAKIAAFCLNHTAVAPDHRGCDKAEAPERHARFVAIKVRPPPKRNGLRLIRHFALSFCLSMIFSENRYPLFGIML